MKSTSIKLLSSIKSSSLALVSMAGAFSLSFLHTREVTFETSLIGITQGFWVFLGNGRWVFFCLALMCAFILYSSCSKLYIELAKDN